jgi:L-lactate dehydrogenase
MKIGIIGAGNVGAAAANALVLRGVGREVVLVDLDQKRAQAEADDILHAAPFAHSLHVRAGDYSDLDGCRVVIITAGVGQRPGETRLQLLGRNASVFRQIIPRVVENAPDAVLVVATNPVDIMTHLAARYAVQQGVPSTRVIGSGTTLDTARFRTVLSQYLGVDPQHVHAHVLGEHGDSEVLAWSLVTVGNVPLEVFCEHQDIRLDEQVRAQMDDAVRLAAYHIIEGKGATFYGIGGALAYIVNAILRDQRSVLTVCMPMVDVVGVPDVTIALPHLVGGQGVISTLPYPLAEEECAALAKSAQIVRDAIVGLEGEENK